MTRPITRFAPSPNGLLHLGHVYAAMQVWSAAADLKAAVALRIEDTDFTRCRPEYEVAILEDLGWLGFEWIEPVIRQSDRKQHHQTVVQRLKDMELLYPCTCTRKDVEASWQGKPEFGPEGMKYRGTCKSRSGCDLQGEVAWRLDMKRALDTVGDLSVLDFEGRSTDLRPLAEQTGDVVLVRKDIGSSYHLSCVADDADLGTTHIVRGEDMRDSTAVHRVLQGLLEFPVPQYRFHPLILDEQGRKLAKRDGDEGLRVLRDRGLTPQQVLALAQKRS